MKKVMMAVMLMACFGFANAAFPIKLDVGSANEPAQLEPGWRQFLASDNGVTLYDGVKVTLAGTMTYRYRTNVVYDGCLEEELWRDFVYASSGELTMTIEGLAPNTRYEISIGAFDYESRTNVPRAADWKVNGQTILTTSWGVNGVPLSTMMPSASWNYMKSGFAFSDATGKIILQSAKASSGVGSPYAFVNGIIINPATYATNPSPADQAVNIPIDVTLGWTSGADPNDPAQPNAAIRQHYLYFRADDPNFLNVTPIVIPAGTPVAATASYGPMSLLEDKTYYWRVDEAVDNGSGGYTAPSDPRTIGGKVWSFETIKSFAVITGQPVNSKLDAGSTAELNVAFTSFSPAMTVWYKDGIPLPPGGDITITDTDSSSTLSIANFNTADEGSYYCTITNQGGAQSSAAAVLAVKRLLAHYPFEQNGDDVAGLNDGTPVNGMAYSAGIVTSGGQVWAADPNGANYFEVPAATAYPRAGYGKGLEEFTYSFWVKPGTFTGNGRILGAFNKEGADMVSFRNTAVQLNVSGTGSIECLVRVEGDRNAQLTTPADTINSDEWYHIVFTFKNNFMKCYINGVYRYYVDLTSTAPLTGFADWQYPMAIMARNVRGVVDEFYPGLADDLRIYNYELANEAIGQLYYDETGIRACIYGKPELDFSGDCVVNMSDFATFAAHWLDSGLFVPQN